MPRPASEARQGGLWMRFVAPVEEELEESAPRVLMTTKLDGESSRSIEDESRAIGAYATGPPADTKRATDARSRGHGAQRSAGAE